mmetsp:Transcript_19876/g.44206  ORF Transcript_19876/g.44206 Transcript_19876/m.44206 type:complete len:347 (+) Transcript_19876:196-1236(+)
MSAAGTHQAQLVERTGLRRPLAIAAMITVQKAMAPVADAAAMVGVVMDREACNPMRAAGRVLVVGAGMVNWMVRMQTQRSARHRRMRDARLKLTLRRRSKQTWTRSVRTWSAGDASKRKPLARRRKRRRVRRRLTQHAVRAKKRRGRLRRLRRNGRHGKKRLGRLRKTLQRRPRKRRHERLKKPTRRLRKMQRARRQRKMQRTRRLRKIQRARRQRKMQRTRRQRKMLPATRRRMQQPNRLPKMQLGALRRKRIARRLQRMTSGRPQLMLRGGGQTLPRRLQSRKPLMTPTMRELRWPKTQPPSRRKPRRRLPWVMLSTLCVTTWVNRSLRPLLQSCRDPTQRRCL